MVAITTASTRFPSRPALVLLPPVTRTGARIYRRRRLAVLCAALLLVGFVAALVSVARSASSDVRMAPADAAIVHEPAAYGTAGQPLPPRAVYVVQPGDTIWSIAHEIDPSGDVRATVDRIVGLNGHAALQPGQRLRLNGDG